MSHIYVLDWLVNKPVRLTGELPDSVSYGHKIVYKDEDKKEQVGIVLGYKVSTNKTGEYLYPLIGQQAENFSNYQQQALDLFKTFKTDFKAEFAESVPVTARMNLFGNHVYFYFFAETRFNFADFVKNFRQKIGYNFFLYQVGARDRIRLDPRADGMYCASGHGTGLDCKMFKHPMPTVESDTIMLQQLEGRDIEKLKGLCGKLKCSLNYEKDIYEEETKKYPSRGTEMTFHDQKMRSLGFNILTEEIKLRNDEHGQIIKISLDEYQKHAKNISAPEPRRGSRRDSSTDARQQPSEE